MNRGVMDGIDGFRPERRKSLEPDETEGRMIYRQRADGEARMQEALSRRRVRLKPDG